jgi:hypothetical protein
MAAIVVFWLNVASRTPPGHPPHTLATAIGESLNRLSPALKYQRSSYLRAGTERNVTNRIESILASNSVLGGRGGYFGDEARITMHFSQRRLPCGSIIQRRAIETGRPSDWRKKALKRKDDSGLAKIPKMGLPGIEGKDSGLPISSPSARTLMDKWVQYSPRVGGSAGCRPTVRSRGPTNR